MLNNAGKLSTGCVAILLLLALSMFLNGAFVWIAFWLLHKVFINVPELSLWHAVLIGIALSIIGGFFKKSGNG